MTPLLVSYVSSHAHNNKNQGRNSSTTNETLQNKNVLPGYNAGFPLPSPTIHVLFHLVPHYYLGGIFLEPIIPAKLYGSTSKRSRHSTDFASAAKQVTWVQALIRHGLRLRFRVLGLRHMGGCQN